MQNGRWLALALAGLGLGCQSTGGPGDSSDAVGVTTQALSACDETVPANRNVDGIPAYAQCTASEDSPIFSNNGVDTSLAAMGSDWVKTQYSGGYQCTEFAHRYWHFKWGVKWIPNGNAGTWCDSVPPASSGVVQSMTPLHGDVMVLAPGSCGASTEFGHVNVVDVVDPGGAKLTAVEQNGARRGQYMVSCAKCFLHIMANDGVTVPGGAAAPAPAGTGAVASAGTGGLVVAAGTGGLPLGGRSGRPARAGSAAPDQPITPPQPAQPTTPIVAAPGGSAAPLPTGQSFAGTTATPTTPVTVPMSNRSPAEKGCSIIRVTAGTPASFAWFSLFAGALFVRRRRPERA